MSNESFDNALVNNEVDLFFRGLDNYFCLNRDYGDHNYSPAMFLVLSDIQSGKIESELFVHEFTSFVKGLRNNPDDQEHFFQNIYFYLRNVHRIKTIDTDLLFNDVTAESTIRHYLHENKDCNLGKRIMSYIQRDFPQAKILTYLD